MGTDNEAKGSESPYAAVDAKLKTVVEALPTVPSWHDAWTRLGSDSTEEDRLVVYQDIRRAGSVPEAASFWLVSYVIDEIATRDADDALGDQEGRLRAIEEAHGFDDGGVWPSSAAPSGYAELRKEYYQAWDALFARKLEEFGEHEMARLFREDYERFEQLTAEGGAFFHGPDVAE